MDAITRYLGVGSYAQWDEETRQSWLLTELQGKRPLLPRNVALADLGFDEIVQVLGLLRCRSRHSHALTFDEIDDYLGRSAFLKAGIVCRVYTGAWWKLLLF